MATPDWLSFSQLSGHGDTVITITASSYVGLIERISSFNVSGITKHVTVGVVQGPYTLEDNVIIYKTSSHQTTTPSQARFAEHIVSNTYDAVNDIGTMVFDAPLTELTFDNYYVPSMAANWRNQYFGSFANNTDLTAIYLPNSIVGINNASFSGCSNLTTIALGDGVMVAGNKSFESCWFSSLTLTQKATMYCGSNAFLDAAMLSEITLLGGGGISGLDTSSGQQTVPNSFSGISAIGTIYIPADVSFTDIHGKPLTSTWTIDRSTVEESTRGNFWLNHCSLVFDSSGRTSDDGFSSAGTVSLEVHSDSDWEVRVESGSTWITLSQTSGTSGTTFVTVDALSRSATTYWFPSIPVRTDRLVFTNGSKVKYCRVTQYIPSVVYYRAPSSISPGINVNKTFRSSYNSSTRRGYYEFNGTLTQINSGVFSNSGYTAIELCQGLKKIKAGAFSASSSLSAITVHTSDYIELEEGALTGLPSTGRLYYPPGAAANFAHWLTALGSGWTGYDTASLPVSN